VWTVFRPLRTSLAETGRTLLRLRLSSINVGIAPVFTAAVLAMVLAALWTSRDWPFDAKLVPHAAAWAAVVFACLNLAAELFAPRQERAPERHAHGAIDALAEPVLEPSVVRRRAIRYFGWLAAFALLSGAIGLLPAIIIFVVLFMRFEFGEAWHNAVAASVAATLFLWGVFDRVLTIPWPEATLGDMAPALRQMTGLM
jgi:hypothetical protein